MPVHTLGVSAFLMPGESSWFHRNFRATANAQTTPAAKPTASEPRTPQLDLMKFWYERDGVGPRCP